VSWKVRPSIWLFLELLDAHEQLSLIGLGHQHAFRLGIVEGEAAEFGRGQSLRLSRGQEPQAQGDGAQSRARPSIERSKLHAVFSNGPKPSTRWLSLACR
jgi:hypothetical protein